MSRLIGTVHLKLEASADGKADLRQGFSAVALVGRYLWAACDETATLERLTWLGEGRFGEHRSFALEELLDLPNPGEEVDLEGLAWAPPYLWLVGSHSRRRGHAEEGGAEERIAALAEVDTQDNRYLLARLPLHEEEGGEVVPCRECPDPNDPDLPLTAARLRGDGRDSQLVEELRGDPHLRRSFRAPSKENGFDVEGLAAANGRLFLGLRGPVLRGWAVVLEVEPRQGKNGMLRLRRIGPGKRRYRKHFLDLDGLGVRELVASGDDLLVLAGPTMDLPAPAALYRWPGALHADGDTIVGRDDLERLMDLPHDVQGGKDHPEGLCFLPLEGIPPSVLVVYDSAARHRVTRSGIRADVFALPKQGEEG
ncbi:MAG TPA: DUF3616 domain-containing protein [Longimicrobium sp.]|jgi:hypothetical protein